MALRFAIFSGLVLLVEGVRACATCSGPADSPQTLGMNAAILTLLGVLCVVGLTVLGFVGAIAWRVARYQPESPPSNPLQGPATAGMELS